MVGNATFSKSAASESLTTQPSVLFEASAQEPEGMAISPDGRYLADAAWQWGAEGSKVRIWAVDDKKLLPEFSTSG